jgi:hypothetical protein
MNGAEMKEPKDFFLPWGFGIGGRVGYLPRQRQSQQPNAALIATAT